MSDLVTRTSAAISLPEGPREDVAPTSSAAVLTLFWNAETPSAPGVMTHGDGFIAECFRGPDWTPFRSTVYPAYYCRQQWMNGGARSEGLPLQSSKNRKLRMSSHVPYWLSLE